jgi:hypothetical protein
VERIPFTIASKQSKPKSKLNKGCEWSLQGELQTYEEKIEEHYRR